MPSGVEARIHFRIFNNFAEKKLLVFAASVQPNIPLQNNMLKNIKIQYYRNSDTFHTNLQETQCLLISFVASVYCYIIGHLYNAAYLLEYQK